MDVDGAGAAPESANADEGEVAHSVAMKQVVKNFAKSRTDFFSRMAEKLRKQTAASEVALQLGCQQINHNDGAHELPESATEQKVRNAHLTCLGCCIDLTRLWKEEWAPQYFVVRTPLAICDGKEKADDEQEIELTDEQQRKTDKAYYYH